MTVVTVSSENLSRTYVCVRLYVRIVILKTTVILSLLSLTKSLTNIKNTMNKQNDIQLSEHFSLSEFTKSITAERLGIDNKPGYEQVLAMRNLCREVLEPLRQHYGQPIRITSGYRCEALNMAVGGVSNSQHQYGEAADLSVPSEAVARDWFQWIVRNTEFDQLLFEHSRRLRNCWLHISCRWDITRNRHQSFFNYQAR